MSRQFIIALKVLTEEVKLLTQALEALEERVEALEIKSNRKPGRPPNRKDEDDARVSE